MTTQEDHDMYVQQLRNVRATMLAKAQEIRDQWGFANDSGFIAGRGASDNLTKAVAYGRWRALVEMVEQLDQGRYVEAAKGSAKANRADDGWYERVTKDGF